jgi:Spy/CpxP family protein refolding chaperone
MKSRIMRSSCIAATLVAISLLAASANARPRGPGHFERIASLLDLDAETEGAIRAIVEETRAEGHALHDEVWEHRRVLRELMSQDTPDEAAIMAQIEALGEAETHAHKHRTRTMLRIRALLTPEQRAQMVEMRGEHRERVLDECATDLEALCPDAEGGRAAVGCLRRHLDEVSDACRDALPRRGPWHGKGGPGRGPRPF